MKERLMKKLGGQEKEFEKVRFLFCCLDSVVFKYFSVSEYNISILLSDQVCCCYEKQGGHIH